MSRTLPGEKDPVTPPIVWIAALAVVAVVAIAMITVAGQFLRLWVQALLSDAPVGMLELVGMRLRKVDLRSIVISRIRAHKAGTDIPTSALETHYLAGGNVSSVVSAMIAARGARIDLPWGTASAIDLAGRDILEAVRMSVNPKVIDCPRRGGPRATIDGVAQDGIQVRTTARVTVRTNIPRLVGGATEETIIARVGEGIVTTIGSAASHRSVLSNPNNISKTVMAKGLDAGTAFEILSIDIATVEVGENIGAKLQVHQAEADMRRFQAEAETRRALAMASQQEFLAQVRHNRALVVLAESAVPSAMAAAFRSGRRAIMG